MLLFVGLGNPGSKYASNRHNIGFMALDEIAEHNGFFPWRNKFQAKLSEGELGGEKVILLKPQTFMNLSGQSHIARGNAFNRTIIVKEHLSSCEPRIDLDAHILSLLCEPAADVTH